MLYFGSFNPVHNAHISIAEYAVEQGLADMVVLVVSPQNPFKRCEELAPEFNRFEMAEMAAATSGYPDRIQASAVEMTLPAPSYTIDTLRFLGSECPETEFSILLGGDNAENLGLWKESGAIIDNYKIYVYPRSGEDISKFPDCVTVLCGAPLFDISSTEIRRDFLRGADIGDRVPAAVADYIRTNKLWE